MLAVQLDAQVRFSLDYVKQEAVQQLRIPAHDIRVLVLSKATFLLRFSGQHQRIATLNTIPRVGHTGLCLMPWSRCVGASNELAKYRFCARLCIEGIPKHVRQAESVSSLFKNLVFIDEMHCAKEKTKEEFGVCLWSWTSDPDGFAKIGTLEVVELVTPPEGSNAEFFEDGGLTVGLIRQEAARLMWYPVLIHLDRVLDYSTPLNSPSLTSVDSGTSGLPDESLEEAWPIRHPFLWRLGVPDGGRDAGAPRFMTDWEVESGMIRR